MADAEEFDRFQQEEARIQQLKELARELHDGSDVPMADQMKRLKALTKDSDQERPKPTPADKERMFAELKQKYGDLPRKKLIMKEVGSRLKDIRSFSQEMHRASQQDLGNAIVLGDMAQVRRLIAQGVDVNRQCAAGYSLIMLAGILKHGEIVQVLREAGADVGLHEAALIGDTGRLRLLLDSGAEINTKNLRNGYTALNWAAGVGRLESVRLLLAREAEVDNVGDRGFTPLLSAALKQHAEIVALLVAAGAAVGVVEAALLGDSALLRRLLDEGADIHSENAACMDPFIAASACGHTDIMRLLLDRGADPHRVTTRHFTALTWAITYDQRKAVHLLLDGGVDVNAPRQDESEYLRGATPLYPAIEQKLPEMCRLLIERGARMDVRDASGQTPLHWAARTCDPDVLRILLDAGADIDAPGQSRGTPLMSVVNNTLIKKEVHRACTRLLLDRGANVNARAEHGTTALMMAAERGHGALVEMLLEAGAEIDATDDNGRTALAAAGFAGHAEVVALLKSYGAKVDLGPNLLMAALFGHNDVLKTLLFPRFWRRRRPRSSLP